jgi:hypothetical protein
MRSTAIFFVVFTLASSFGRAADIGTIDQKEPPAKKELLAPKVSDGIESVGVHATIEGKTSKEEKRNIYVLVNPLSNPANQDAWWVQPEIKRDGERFDCSCQFGEDEKGAGEFFAIVGIATDKELSAGAMLQGLPKAMAYTKLKIVRRQ